MFSVSMKLERRIGIAAPDEVVWEVLSDIEAWPSWNAMYPRARGELRIGALVTNTALAKDERVLARYPLLASAILAGASPQLRKAATTGGNLLQRPRCWYLAGYCL